MGVRVRYSLGLAALGVALLVPAVARGSQDATEDAGPSCGPVTIDSMFPDAPADAPSVGDTPSTNPAPKVETRCAPYVYSMTFPIAVESPLISFFGADRDGGARKHKGTDIAAPKMTPVVAVSDGTVTWIRDEQGGDCCALGVRHDDGWYSYYIHLNNDTLGTDDGLGYGMAPGIELGSRVTEGQVIGYVGDSGNAEETVPHVHFEIRTPARIAIDPGPSLRAAARISAAGQATADGAEPASSLFGTTGGTIFAGAFADDELSLHSGAIDGLASLGVLSGCDDGGLSFCPDEAATGANVIEWLANAAGMDVDPSTAVDYGVDSAGVERRLLTSLSSGVTAEELRGCGERRFCADDPITRGEFAALLAGVLEYGGTAPDAYIDDQGHRFEDQIDLLVREEIADKCAAPGAPAFAPDALLTRGQLATFLARLVGMEQVFECSTLD